MTKEKPTLPITKKKYKKKKSTKKTSKKVIIKPVVEKDPAFFNEFYTSKLHLLPVVGPITYADYCEILIRVESCASCGKSYRYRESNTAVDIDLYCNKCLFKQRIRHRSIDDNYFKPGYITSDSAYYIGCLFRGAWISFGSRDVLVFTLDYDLSLEVNKAMGSDYRVKPIAGGSMGTTTIRLSSLVSDIIDLGFYEDQDSVVFPDIPTIHHGRFLDGYIKASPKEIRGTKLCVNIDSKLYMNHIVDYTGGEVEFYKDKFWICYPLK